MDIKSLCQSSTLQEVDMTIPHMRLRRGSLILAILMLIGIGFVLIQLFVTVGPLTTPEDIMQALEDKEYEIQNLKVNSEETCWPYAAIIFDTYIANEQYNVTITSCPDRFSTWRSVYWFLESRGRRGASNTACFLHKTMVIIVMPRDRQAVRELKQLVRSIH